MGYCTLADIENYLDPDQVVDLSDDDNDEIPDAAVIAEAIAAADADIDVYLANRYTTPILPVPNIIRKMSARMAIHYLYLRRKEAPIPEKWDKDYDELMELLREISRGEITLGVTTISVNSEIRSSLGKEDMHFSFDKLRRF